jgi:hypothetical protein
MGVWEFMFYVSDSETLVLRQKGNYDAHDRCYRSCLKSRIYPMRGAKHLLHSNFICTFDGVII